MVYKKYKRLQIFNHLITQGMLNIELSYSQQSSSRNFFFRSIQIPCPSNEISLLRLMVSTVADRVVIDLPLYVYYTTQHRMFLEEHRAMRFGIGCPKNWFRIAMHRYCVTLAAPRRSRETLGRKYRRNIERKRKRERETRGESGFVRYTRCREPVTGTNTPIRRARLTDSHD